MKDSNEIIDRILYILLGFSIACLLITLFVTEPQKRELAQAQKLTDKCIAQTDRALSQIKFCTNYLDMLAATCGK